MSVDNKLNFKYSFLQICLNLICLLCSALSYEPIFNRETHIENLFIFIESQKRLFKSYKLSWHTWLVFGMVHKVGIINI